MLGLSPMLILGALLALSLAGNALLFKLRDSAKAETATALASYEQAKESALQCSNGVALLAKAGADREARAKAALAAAQGRAAFHEAAAMQTLQARPIDAQDACKSAEALIRSTLAGRNPAGVKP